MVTERFEKRFGVIAVEKGFIAPEQLFKDLKIQVMEDIDEGRHRLIGDILNERKAMTNLQISEVVESIFLIIRGEI